MGCCMGCCWLGMRIVGGLDVARAAHIVDDERARERRRVVKSESMVDWLIGCSCWRLSLDGISMNIDNSKRIDTDDSNRTGCVT